MRWDGQAVAQAELDGALPGLERLGLVRSIRVPKFDGITFHEVLCKSALNKVPEASNLPFRYTVNAYRGCSHACRYCFARPTHEYLDFDSGNDFDRELVVKTNVAEVLRRELFRRSWTRDAVALGTNTDPYQRAEGRYALMPGIIAALADSGTPFSILTKGTLLRRDLPLLADAAKEVRVTLAMSIAVFDDTLQRSLEPGTPTAEARLDTVRAATDAGFRVTVFLMPILPHLTDSVAALDHALGRIRAAGAARVVYGALHLRPGAKEWFLQWLEREHPELVSSYLGLYPGVSVQAPQAYRRWLGKRVQPLLRMHRLDGWDEDDHPRGRPQPGLASRTATAPRLGPVRTTGSTASARPSVAPASEPTLF